MAKQFKEYSTIERRVVDYLTPAITAIGLFFVYWQIHSMAIQNDYVHESLVLSNRPFCMVEFRKDIRIEKYVNKFNPDQKMMSLTRMLRLQNSGKGVMRVIGCITKPYFISTSLIRDIIDNGDTTYYYDNRVDYARDHYVHPGGYEDIMMQYHKVPVDTMVHYTTAVLYKDEGGMLYATEIMEANRYNTDDTERGFSITSGQPRVEYHRFTEDQMNALAENLENRKHGMAKYLRKTEK